ncbi:hypothetical protein C3486_21440 [Streptomyces sp. Ru73]|uniref:hypothetical protein n=1 Tax=Streptomyces sp. Ru73 TaxID=2080748 RepID=UPI000CDD9214|nr:hypothetical protein [Streptomyces sp. Ru73]POX38761.1 hypothetical protein C3486_21440 [Streptomyces sp. Ru73]
MDTTELDNAYRHLLAAAGVIGDTAPLAPDSRSGIDWTLSHIALSDRILAAAARDVLTGLPAIVDNREAMDEAAISSLIASTTHTQRVDLVSRNAADLSAVLRATPDQAAAIPVTLRLVSREGRPLPEQRVPWGDLIRLRATEHLPGHTTRIRLLASAQ